MSKLTPDQQTHNITMQMAADIGRQMKDQLLYDAGVSPHSYVGESALKVIDEYIRRIETLYHI